MQSIFTFSEGRRALVTGGASGIGLSVAQRLLAVGAHVGVADLPASLDRMDASARGSTIRIEMDVRDDASVAAGVQTAVQQLGGLDTVINSAGVFQFRALESVTTAEWDRILDVNLRGTFLVLREAMPHLKSSGRGRVVNLASDAGKKGFALISAYCASKFGVVGLTQAVAAETAPYGVRVNAVCPASIADTGMGHLVADQKVELGLGATREEVWTKGAASFPLKRLGTAADVADAIMFLISENSNWITGESLNIDGGSLAG
jgi:meso-butanediol dehydrogenase/(S,S)-butanediol dehydrogenase/diacetyl reductase